MVAPNLFDPKFRTTRNRGEDEEPASKTSVISNWDKLEVKDEDIDVDLERRRVFGNGGEASAEGREEANGSPVRYTVNEFRRKVIISTENRRWLSDE